MNDLTKNRIIMNDEDLSRTLRRMAHQLWEHNAERNLALVGILKRGVTLARRIQTILNPITNKEIPIGELDIGLYRDDIGLTPVAPEVRSTDIPFDVEGKEIILVDDVLFTGRTVRSALNALMDLGRPHSVQLLVLIDRGHRELPIQADYVGKEVDTYPKEKVAVCLKEDDGVDEVYIVSEGH